MADAEKCPVCGGRGEVAIDEPTAVDRDLQRTHETCRGCGGKGGI